MSRLDIKPFHDAVTCGACGWNSGFGSDGDHEARYVPHRNWFVDLLGEVTVDRNARVKVQKPALLVRCGRCGYPWLMELREVAE